MPVKKSAMKELKKSKKRSLRNAVLKKALRRKEKNMNALIMQKKTEKINAALNKFLSDIDKAAAAKIIHKNAAARKKSRFLRRINKLKVKPSSPA